MKAAKKGKKKGKKRAGGAAGEDEFEDFFQDQDVNMAEPVNPKITKEPPKVAPIASPQANGGILKRDDTVKVLDQTQ